MGGYGARFHAHGTRISFIRFGIVFGFAARARSMFMKKNEEEGGQLLIKRAVESEAPIQE